jgi:hypothetical protein
VANYYSLWIQYLLPTTSWGGWSPSAIDLERSAKKDQIRVFHTGLAAYSVVGVPLPPGAPGT